jgi:hypothetical protein
VLPAVEGSPSAPAPPERKEPGREDVPPLLLRIGLALVALLLAVDPRYHLPIPAWPFALLLLAGGFSRLNALLTLLFGIRAAVTPPLTPLNYLPIVTLGMMMRRITMLGPGELSLDAVLRRRGLLQLERFRKPRDPGKEGRYARLQARRRRNWRNYEGYILRVTLALVLLPIGLHFALRGPGWVALLGEAWLACGALLAAGLFTAWAAIAAAALLPLATLATGSPFWEGLPFAAVALLYMRYERVSLDEVLARRSAGFARLRWVRAPEPLPPGPAGDEAAARPPGPALRP